MNAPDCSDAESEILSLSQKITYRSYYLFKSRFHQSDHITTRQYARLLKTWLVEIGLDPYEYATHSIRRTKVSLTYQKTRNIRAIQLLLGHSNLESIVRYPGVELDDALDVAENTVVDYSEIIKHLFFNRRLIFQLLVLYVLQL